MSAKLNQVDFSALLYEVTKRITSEVPYSRSEADLVRVLSKKLKGKDSEDISEAMKTEYLDEISKTYTELEIRTAIGYWEFHRKPKTY